MSGFLGIVLRQRLLQRWSLMDCHRNENVLEHTAVVGMLALLAGHIGRHQGRDLNVEKMINHALVHDFNEVLTQDVISPIKAANAEIASGYAKLEAAAEAQILDTLPDYLRDAIYDDCHPGGYEQELVKALDSYAAYIKCRQEMAAGNQVEFGDALTKMTELVEKLTAKYPELCELHRLFGDSLCSSVDELLRSKAADHIVLPLDEASRKRA
ncbi:5'-deoxynucleotidase [Neiella marina]|uniref:5'-deoxynucleotidase n=1 Tax=Neiella holothuriorum TaxID=2870530 RepID=A0ABS7EKR6_9GAMM|nr:5'-deoxynucleotidase [Neiella holothuriorum]MBW8192948.1 5'-deoxynucleotidase [Neiella holothuriorum]